MTVRVPKYVLALPEEVRWQGKDDVQLRALAVNGYASDLSAAITLAVEAAHQSPCHRSKRGAVAFAKRTMHRPPDPVGREGTAFISAHNHPIAPFTCSGSEQCKAACRHLCDHAEASVVAKWSATKYGPLDQGPSMFDVVHIELRPNDAGVWEPVAFDREGQPKGPSCITCARDMLRAEARLVWLWGVEGWRWWYAQDFFRDTLEELKLVDAAMLPARIAGPRSTP